MTEQEPKKAVLLINVDLGREKDVFLALRSIDDVKEAHIVYGVYDIFAIVESMSKEQLNKSVLENIRRIPGIRSTLTMVVV